MQRLTEHLTRTSRTFALAIRLLPAALRREVSIAYLLLRVADTLEDADLWKPEQRIDALARLEVLVGAGDAAEAAGDSARWADERPCDHEGYLELVRELPLLLDALAAVAPGSRATIVRHVRRTISGMRAFLARGAAPADLALTDLEDLRRYCYIVAGIVGEMLTELFVAHGHLAEVPARALAERAATVGEALQLVNILKDADEDTRAGRSLLPPEIDRARVFTLARADLDIADDYVATLRRAGASWGVVGFVLLPVRLARATLDRVAEDGPGAKLTRAAVLEHLDHVTTMG